MKLGKLILDPAVPFRDEPEMQPNKRREGHAKTLVPSIGGKSRERLLEEESDGQSG